MISLYTGNIASGKTFAALEFMSFCLLSGRKVYSNIDSFEIDHFLKQDPSSVCIPFSSLISLSKEECRAFWQNKAPGSLIVIDEAHRYFGYDWDDKPKSKELLKWLRSDDGEASDVILICQSERRISKRVLKMVRRFSSWSFNRNNDFLDDI